MLTAVLIVSSVVAILLFYLAVKTHRDGPDRAELARLKTRAEDLEIARKDLRKNLERLEYLQRENATLKADLENEKNNLKLQQESEERLKKEFENLSNRIFENRSKVFAQQNTERISGLLEPFKEQMDSFRKRVDHVHTEDTKTNARLIEQIRQLTELSNRVSDDANNLAKAIRGESKTQGDWGELIVERIFEASGLQKGIEYETQTSYRDEDGRLKRPDFLVLLPGEKMVVVDSKVSLAAYERYANSQDENTKTAELKAHVASVRKHVEELRLKDYSSLHGNRSLDFVIMCVPLEPAYQAALQADPGLIYDLAQTNVVVSGPSTLLITLKLIAQIWRRENENRNSEKIALRAGRLYDQVSLVVDAMTDAQKKLAGVSESFDLAMKRLHSGRGNLVGRVEKIRILGAKVSRQIPEKLLDETSCDEED